MSESILQRLQRANQRVEVLCAVCSSKTFNARHSPKFWSVGQCLDHAVRSADGIAGECEKALNAHGDQQGEALAWTPNWLEKQFLKAVGPDARGTTPVPSKFAPADEPLEVAERATSADLIKVKARSAAFPLLKLRLAAWLEGVAIHAEYHLGQAEALSKVP